jgi:squalene-associated FAD-dependent desaturase
LGGRARRLAFGPLSVDNGQHLFIAAYSETLRLMELIGLKEDEAFVRLSLQLMLAGKDTRLELNTGKLPAPLHLGWGLLNARGLSRQEKTLALRFSMHLYLSGFQQKTDCSVSSLLKTHKQPEHLIAALWEPLCLATLNTPAAQASAQVFLRVLRDTFGLRRSDSDLLISRTDLGGAFPAPAMDFIERNGGHVHLGSRVTGLELDNDVVTGVLLDGERLSADHVVLTVPPHICQKLLAPHKLFEPLADQLGSFDYQPITTIYLQYPEDTHMETEMLGMVGTVSQWVFDRATCGQPGLMAVVISGPGPHIQQDKEALAQQVIAELAEQFPHWPAPSDNMVIREKRATFSCDVDIEQLRPGNATSAEGLWLAGDFTATGYPATLEGAVRSGVQCARRILAQGASD